VCAVLFGLHAVVAPILMPILASAPETAQALIAQVTDIGPLAESGRGEVIVVNAPSPFHFLYALSKWRLRAQSAPSSIRVLAPGYAPVGVTRLDDRTLLVRVEHGYLAPPGLLVEPGPGRSPAFHVAYVYQQLDRFFRAEGFPMVPGDRVALTGMRAEVIAVTEDGRASDVRVRFAQPLEDPSVRWLSWDWTTRGYVPFVPPAIGATVRLPGPV
jgi:hypothetical protein